MAKFCIQCGKELNENASFCTGCGTQVTSHKISKSQNLETEDRISQKHRIEQSNRNIRITVFSIVGIIVIGIAAYFIVDSFKATKANVAQTASNENSLSTKKKASNHTSSKNNEQTIMNDYINKLNGLSIHSTDNNLSVGEWNISERNGTLFLEATSIPSQDLAGIFELYDAGDLDPLQSWAKDVYNIAEELSRKLNKEWNIDVGNSCVGIYPAALSSADITQYSGSCGYSVPVLAGDDKGNLSLIINNSVFSSSNNTKSTDMASSEYILPGSDFKRLTESEIDTLTLEQLRLARNEIYARHGYIFKSEDLQSYFSEKAWYHKNSSYDGTTLSEVEKYNVELLQTRERSLQ